MPPRKSGEPQIINSRVTRLEQCCDCGLVHLAIYEVKPRKMIKKIVYRDNWLTDRVRKKKGIIIQIRRKK